MTTITCTVCNEPAPYSGQCTDLAANHYQCPNSHRLCAFESFWRTGSNAYCGTCGTQMKFWRTTGKYGWHCPNCDA